MPDPIEFHFDFSSPYGYIAAMRIDDFQLIGRHNIRQQPARHRDHVFLLCPLDASCRVRNPVVSKQRHGNTDDQGKYCTADSVVHR